MRGQDLGRLFFGEKSGRKVVSLRRAQAEGCEAYLQQVPSGLEAQAEVCEAYLHTSRVGLETGTG